MRLLDGLALAVLLSGFALLRLLPALCLRRAADGSAALLRLRWLETPLVSDGHAGWRATRQAAQRHCLPVRPDLGL